MVLCQQDRKLLEAVIHFWILSYLNICHLFAGTSVVVLLWITIRHFLLLGCFVCLFVGWLSEKLCTVNHHSFVCIVNCQSFSGILWYIGMPHWAASLFTLTTCWNLGCLLVSCVHIPQADPGAVVLLSFLHLSSASMCRVLELFWTSWRHSASFPTRHLWWPWLSYLEYVHCLAFFSSLSFPCFVLSRSLGSLTGHLTPWMWLLAAIFPGCSVDSNFLLQVPKPRRFVVDALYYCS